MGTETDNLRMFHTGAHPCGYWEGREARDLVLDPRDPRLPQAYPMALDWGFRRSGDIVYRPSCSGCHACVAVRIPVEGDDPAQLLRCADLALYRAKHGGRDRVECAGEADFTAAAQVAVIAAETVAPASPGTLSSAP